VNQSQTLTPDAGSTEHIRMGVPEATSAKKSAIGARGSARLVTVPSNGGDQMGRTARSRLSAFGDADDRLAGGAAVGSERSRSFGERPYRPNDRLEPSVSDALG